MRLGASINIGSLTAPVDAEGAMSWSTRKADDERGGEGAGATAVGALIASGGEAEEGEISTGTVCCCCSLPKVCKACEAGAMLLEDASGEKGESAWESAGDAVEATAVASRGGSPA